MYRGLMTDFEDDPFFRDHHQRMQSMMGGFRDPFSPFGHHQQALPGVQYHSQPGRSGQHSRQLAQPPDMFDGMFGNMFMNMNSMMANMHRNFEQMANDPNSYSYSSSSVMSYSSDGQGQPKYFQATKSTKKAPGGVRETQHSMRDSESGLHRMAIGHHLDDRSHVIERSVNRRSGEEERKQDFINLDESDAAAFDQEWKQRTRDSSHILRDRQRPTQRALEDHRERPGHQSRHAGIAAPSNTGSVRDRDRLRVNGEAPGTHRHFENRHQDHRDHGTIRDHGPNRDHVINRGHGTNGNHGPARDRDWGTGDFDQTGRSHRARQDREKHVRVNSRPINRHEPHGGL